MILSPESIAEMSEGFATTDLGRRRIVNQLYRFQDDSNLWPINGRFNATEKAIRRARKFENERGEKMDVWEYSMFLNTEISRIVNAAV